MNENEKKNQKLIKAWVKASKDLGVLIETPFLLKIDNEEIKYDLLIKNFGSASGTLILTIDDMIYFNKAEKQGFYCSALNPFHYEKYNKNIFIETLNDWGFFGKEEFKPAWYDGYVYDHEK
jgi:hypothetical protein